MRPSRHFRPDLLGQCLLGLAALAPQPAAAQADRTLAARAAIHPVADPAALRTWLSRVPVTRNFPPDFSATLRGQAPAFVLEISTTPGCLPCGDLWAKARRFGAREGWRVAAIGRDTAQLRSGRLGLPWVGNPVAWVRPRDDSERMVPVAIGTDHDMNLARNIYLAVKMLTGVRPAVGVRGMAKFTGIVGASTPSRRTTGL